ncbi:MAG: CinA family protein [Pedobacter sp.]|nr:MAG: CinA family protein [Pedobacter sp.]
MEKQDVKINRDLIKEVASLLIKSELTIAFVESATGGRLTGEFSMVKNAGKFLRGGLVCYNAKLKEEILKVPHKLIKKFTPESAEVTEAMAIALSDYIDASIHVAVTGLPAPGGSETGEKPVGTMFISAVKGKKLVFSDRILFNGDPEQIVIQTINHCAILLSEISF